MACSCGSQNKIFWHGWKNSTTKLSIPKSTDVFVCPYLQPSPRMSCNYAAPLYCLHCPGAFSERVASWINSRLVHPIGFTLDILWFINPSSDFLRVSVFSFLLLHNFITFLCLLSVDPALVLCHCEVAGLLAFPRRWCLVSNIQLIGNESYESISSAILKYLQDFPKRFQPPSPPAQLGRNHSHVSNLGRLSWSFKPSGL